MRTTLTLEDDVAAIIERLRREQRRDLKTIVNEALRKGLAELEGSGLPRRAFRTKTVSLGRCLIGSIEDVAEALAVGEGEDFR